MAIAADGECGKCGGSKGFCLGAFRFFSTLRGASASIGDAEREREGTGARFAHSGLGAVRPESTAVLLLPCFGRASGLVAGEPPKTPHAGRGLREAVIVAAGGARATSSSPSSGKSNGSRSRRPCAGTSTSSSSSSSSVNASTSKVTRRRFPGVGRNRSAAASAEPRPDPVPGASRGDGTASRAAPNVPGDPNGDADAVPGDLEEDGLFRAAPDGDGERATRASASSGSAGTAWTARPEAPPPRRRARSRSRTGRAWISRGSSRWISASAADHPEPPTRDRSRRAPGNLERREKIRAGPRVSPARGTSSCLCRRRPPRRS